MGDKTLFSIPVMGGVDIPWNASFAWVTLEIVLILSLVLVYRTAKDSAMVVLFESIFEKIYTFFEDILWKEEKPWIKAYVVWVFFVILFSNLLWVTLELLAPIFWMENGEFVLEHYIHIPTAELSFNVVMASLSILIVLFVQLSHLGFGKFIYEYLPVLGKWYVPYNRWNLPAYIDYPLFAIVKIFDIILSIFLGLLEVVWIFAKIISLSFRLFGNITSGAILLWMLVAGLNGFTDSLIWIEFPVLFPLIVYLQETLVALIQAIVFPLLVAIFVKVAKAH